MARGKKEPKIETEQEVKNNIEEKETEVDKAVKTTKKKRNGSSVCRGCGNRFPTKDMVLISGEKFCPYCKDDRLREIQHNKDLNDFLYNLCDKDIDAMPILTSQIKRLKDKYGWKTTGILATLKYIYEGADAQDYDPRYGVYSVIERNYAIVKNYYLKKKEIENAFKKSELEDIINEPPVVIHLKRSSLIQQEKEYWEKQKNRVYGPPLDMDDIPDEDYEDEEGEG